MSECLNNDEVREPLDYTAGYDAVVGATGAVFHNSSTSIRGVLYLPCLTFLLTLLLVRLKHLESSMLEPGLFSTVARSASARHFDNLKLTTC